MRIGLPIIAVASMLLLFSCEKERSFDPNSNNAGGNVGSGLLDRTVTKFGTDSITTSYDYDGQKRLILYKSGGSFLGTFAEVQLKFVRNAQGIIQKSILKTDFFASMGIDSILRIVHYDVSKARYTSMAAAYFDGSDDVQDSTVFIYNTAGKITGIEYFSDYGTGTYDRDGKTEYTYDASGNVTKEKNYGYNAGAYEAYDESVYEFDNKTNPIFLGNEGFVLGDIITFSPNNQTKKTYTDFTDPSANAVATSVYTYNTNNKPATAAQNDQSFPVPFSTTYYYK
jgi:hypothetical protein